MIDYELLYRSRTMACSCKPWKERPQGLIRAHIGRNVVHDRARNYTFVPVVAYCERDGKVVRESHRTILRTSVAKTLRLSLIRREAECPTTNLQS